VTNYTKATDFAVKDSLLSGNPLKLVKGTEINTEFLAVQTAVNSKLDSAGVTAFAATVLDDSTATAARTTLGAAALGANSDITSLNVITSINGGPVAGFKNWLINGRYDIWQRGTSFAVTTTTAVYAADRWFANLGGAGALTVSRQNSSGLNQYGIRLQRDAGNSSVQGVYARQIVEGIVSRNLQTKTVTISATLTAGANFSAAASQVSLLLQTGTTQDQGSASLISGTWTAFASPINTAVTVTTTPTRFSATVTLSSNVQEISAGVYFVPVGTAGANDWVQIDDFQLEIGSVATTFESTRPYGLELAQCQRYYYPYNGGTSGFANGPTIVETAVTFQMRATPTLAAGAGLATINWTGGTSVNPSSINVSNLTAVASGATWRFNNYTGLTSGQGVVIQANVTTLAAFSAEL
jgi:hypothetical protein